MPLRIYFWTTDEGVQNGIEPFRKNKSLKEMELAETLLLTLIYNVIVLRDHVRRRYSRSQPKRAFPFKGIACNRIFTLWNEKYST